MSQSAPDNSLPLRVAGALRGVVRVPSLEAPVAAFRAEAAHLLGVEPSAVKLICGGKTLADDAQRLAHAGVSATSRILVTKGVAAAAGLHAQAAGVSAEEARAAHQERIRAQLDRMASRDSRGIDSGYAFSIQNQAGQAMQLADTDRRAIVMGLALHELGRASLEDGKLQDALQQLLLAEESLLMAPASLLDAIDNLAMCQLDIVWACFKLRDVSRLGVSSQRLASARQALEKAHGKHQERLRQLHGNFSPEQATYLRLELLEGVVAYHSSEPAAAAAALASAQARWQRLQLSEASLLHLREMGYSAREAARALRFAGGDLGAAVEFLTDQRAKAQERKAAQREQRAWLKERARFGKTPRGKYVDQEALSALCQLGYERSLAAEALRQAENELQAALDTLSNPVKRGALQLAMIAHQMLEQEQGPQSVKASHVKQLTAMGFAEKPARVALAAAGDSVEAALERLQDMGDEARAAPAAALAAAAGGSEQAAGSSGQAGASAGAGSSAAAAMQADDAAAASAAAESEPDDEEAEAELLAAVRKRGRNDDPLACYDLDVAEEGEALGTYLRLLASTQPQGEQG